MFSCVFNFLVSANVNMSLPERDSPRDQLVVTLFLLTILGLLLGVSIKNRMLKAGLDSSTAWSASRRWWEVHTVPFRFE
jgi:hypothetical protein